jgi:hypothetical protein
MRIVLQQPVIDDVMDAFSPALGSARRAYAGHAYRVYNIACALLETERHVDALAIASAFHDLGIWSDDTFDYLPPSIARARDYLRDRGADADADLVVELIQHHHRLRRVRDGLEPALVEAFRVADLVDVTAGLYRAGLPRSFLRELDAAFPNAGFQRVLLRAAGSWCRRHPLRPLPMLEF